MIISLTTSDIYIFCNQLSIEVSGAKTQTIFDEVFDKIVEEAQPIPGFRRVKGGKVLDEVDNMMPACVNFKSHIDPSSGVYHSCFIFVSSCFLLDYVSATLTLSYVSLVESTDNDWRL